MTAFKRWLVVLLALPGVAAILLPFSESVSPMKVIMEAGGQAPRTLAADHVWAAIPFFAAPMILDWQVRRARGIWMSGNRAGIGPAPVWLRLFWRL